MTIHFDGTDATDHAAWARYHRAIAAHVRTTGDAPRAAAHEALAAKFDRKALRGAK